jgi:predicted nicotinamide N-methyase
VALPRPTDLVEETIVVAGEPISLFRPRDSDDLLAEEAFDQEELLPYWAELWPSSVALAQTVGARALRGTRTLELGCGLGLVSIAAARAGGRVLATDWSAEALRFTRDNAARNDVEIETMLVDWSAPEAILERGPWQLVLGSDVLYERRNVDQMLELLPRLVDSSGEVWIADPGRQTSMDFVLHSQRAWRRKTTEHNRIEIHRLRLRDLSAS